MTRLLLATLWLLTACAPVDRPASLARPAPDVDEGWKTHRRQCDQQRSLWGVARDPAALVTACEAYLETRPASKARFDTLYMVDLGFALVAIGQPARALPCFETALEEGRGGAALGLCVAYVAAGRDQEALPFCERMARSIPVGNHEQSPLYHGALAYYRLRRYEEAGDLARRYTRMGSDGRGHLLLGKIRYMQGRYVESIEHLRDARRRMPRDHEVSTELARSLIAMDQVGEAIKLLRARMALEPCDAEVFMLLEIAYRRYAMDGEAAAIAARRCPGG
jgi:hypothetical protein